MGSKISEDMQHELNKLGEKCPHAAEQNMLNLYRYMKFSPEKPMRARELFVDGWLSLSKPHRFNDPFECRAKIIWPQDENAMKQARLKAIENLVRKGYTTEEAGDAVALLSSGEGKRIEGYETENKLLSTDFDDHICSFSANFDNLLLWSHYADSHRGFCIAFFVGALPINFSQAVNYADEYPELNYPLSNNSLSQRLLPQLTKSKHWAYEEEYRLIINRRLCALYNLEFREEGDYSSIRLPPGSIKGVYLGALMDDASKKSLCNMIFEGTEKKTFDHFPVFRTKLDDTSYKLDIEVHRMTYPMVY